MEKNHRSIRRHHISRRYPFCEATFVIDVQNTITAVWSIRRRPSTVRGGRSGRGGGEEQRICGFLRSIVHTFEGYVWSGLTFGERRSSLVSKREEKDAGCDERYLANETTSRGKVILSPEDQESRCDVSRRLTIRHYVGHPLDDPRSTKPP